MTSSSDRGGFGALAALGAQDAHAVELQRLIESVAYCAHQWYGAAYLIVDRCADPLVTDVMAYLGSDCGTGRLVDLWDLNPLLWDDAHWAAQRLVFVGEARVVLPELHRG